MEYPRYIADIEADDLLDGITTIHCIVAKDTKTGEALCFHDRGDTISPYHGSIKDGIALLNDSPLTAWHNGLKYDTPAIQKVTQDMHVLPYDRCFDTVLMSQIIWPDIGTRQDIPKAWHRDIPPRLRGSYSLEAWGYRLGTHKIQYEQGFQTFSQTMLDYCIGDVATLSALVKECYRKGFSEQCWREEHEFAWLMFLQEQHGWRFNMQAAGELHAKLSARKEELLALTVPLRAPKVVVGKVPQWYQIDHTDGSFPKYDTLGELMADWRTFRRDPKETRTSVRSRVLPGPPKETLIPFNPTSRPQVIEYLTETFGWQPSVWGKNKKVKDGVKPADFEGLRAEGWSPKVDDEVLSSLPYEETKPLAELYMVAKRLGQLSDGKQALLRVVTDGRMHGQVHSAGTATGRCSHSNPNVAQTPASRSPYGHEFRGLYQAEPSWRMLGFDASALELRILAAYLAYWDGGKYSDVVDDPDKDVHTINQHMAGLPTRDAAKTFIYACAFGAGPAKIGKIVGKGPAAGKRLLATFKKNFTGFPQLMERVSEAAKRGYLKFPDGRHANIRSAHAALNVLLQGVGGLVMKQTTRIWVRKLRQTGLRVFGLDCPWWDRRQSLYDFALVGNIHDENQATLRPQLADKAGELALESLYESGQHYDLRCPIRGEYKVGDTWADTH